MCGPRTQQLKVIDHLGPFGADNHIQVENAKRYGWEPKALLLQIGDLFTNLAKEEMFLKVWHVSRTRADAKQDLAALASAADLKVFAKTRDTLSRRCAAGPVVDAAFAAFFAAVEQVI